MKKSISLILLGFMVACTSDKIDVIEAECPDIYTYNTNVRDIINVSCAVSSCHIPGGDGPSIYLSYQQMIPDLENGTLETEIKNGTMPKDPIPNLTEDELNILICWLNAGHPE